MFNVDTFSPWVLLTDLGIISGLLLIGQLIRAKVKIIQQLFIPPSLLAGLLGLAFGPNGLDFLDFDNFGFVTIGGLLIIIGAVLGVVLNFINAKNKKMLQLVALILSIAGGVVLFIGFNDNVIYKTIAKGFIKHAYMGFYVVLAGWVVGVVGYLTGK
mgnify:CR=1 FL=1